MSVPASVCVARVCLVDMRAIGDLELADHLAWLGPTEMARHGRFVQKHRRRQFLIGRILLRRMLGCLLSVAPIQVKLIERPGQAPLLDGMETSPGFSLSHSGHWVACAVSAQTRLGLDIEVIDLERDVDALAEHAFDAAQAAMLKQLPMAQRVPAFYRRWSMQEARCKLGNCGDAAAECISLPHPALSVALCSAQPLLVMPAIELVALL